MSTTLIPAEPPIVSEEFPPIPQDLIDAALDAGQRLRHKLHELWPVGCWLERVEGCAGQRGMLMHHKSDPLVVGVCWDDPDCWLTYEDRERRCDAEWGSTSPSRYRVDDVLIFELRRVG